MKTPPHLRPCLFLWTIIGSDNSLQWKYLLTLPSRPPSAADTVCISLSTVESAPRGEGNVYRKGKVVLAAPLHNYLSMFPLGVSVTVTPASVSRGNMVAWSVPANITQWEWTARDVTPFTRTDPGPGPLGTPPTSVWVSSLPLGRCHKPIRCTQKKKKIHGAVLNSSDNLRLS